MEKEQLRASLKPLGPVPHETSRKVVAGLFEWLSRRIPGTIGAYLAMQGEVDVSDLFERLPGWRWVLPRVERDLTCTFRDRDIPRETHQWGMRQPVDAGPAVAFTEMDVILVPGLAFDRSGGRLGRGAGFYDRVLALVRTDCQRIGVTVSHRIIDDVPAVDHDEPVEMLASEAGVIRCTPRK